MAQRSARLGASASKVGQQACHRNSASTSMQMFGFCLWFRAFATEPTIRRASCEVLILLYVFGSVVLELVLRELELSIMYV